MDVQYDDTDADDGHENGEEEEEVGREVVDYHLTEITADRGGEGEGEGWTVDERSVEYPREL